ncbi:MAG: hypothetical protein KDB22_19815, partial [Planctomycetales bacterium]|nr:hypothetical protein [Planctomycetales bacterium]
MNQAGLYAKWIEHAIEQRLIDAVEASQILLQAAQAETTIHAVVYNTFANDAEKLVKLRQLLEEISRQSELFSPQAETIGKTTGPRKSRKSAPPSQHGQATLASGQAKHPRGDQSTQPKSGRHRESSRQKSPAEESKGRNSHRLGAKLAQQLSGIVTGLERYQELGEIGRGGCGVVTQALDLQIQRNVVLKRIVDHHEIT